MICLLIILPLVAIVSITEQNPEDRFDNGSTTGETVSIINNISFGR